MHVHQSPHARSLEAKARFLGLTAIGDTAALHQVIDTGAFDSAQVVYNMLNPSAAVELPANYPAQDYGRLFDHTRAAGVGVVDIRVLAGGALSGSAERHPIASASRTIRRSCAMPFTNSQALSFGEKLGKEIRH
jgi:aryl-alcohol dehydrogenase-like predicted oxidoreductase